MTHQVGLWEAPIATRGRRDGASTTVYRLRGALIVSVCVELVV